MKSTFGRLIIAIVIIALLWFVLKALAPLRVSQPVFESYVNEVEHFSLRFPEGYLFDEGYRYQEFGEGRELEGVKFTIPPALAEGTNLSTDTYVSVERLKEGQACHAASFLPLAANEQTVVDQGVTYLVASSTGAAAGNRYEEIVYALPKTSPCVGVRYFIHYGAIENYPEGAVRGFNRSALIDDFDAIRRSLVVK